MTKVIATKADNRFVVQFDDGKTYTALVEAIGNRLEAFHATSCNGTGNVRSYNLDRNGKLLGEISNAINA